MAWRQILAEMGYGFIIVHDFLQQDQVHQSLQVNGERECRSIGAYELAKAVEELGAGEILLNCIDCDRMNDLSLEQVPIISFPYKLQHVWKSQGKGFDVDLIKLISGAESIPVISSSGAGAVEHFSDVFMKSN